MAGERNGRNDEVGAKRNQYARMPNAATGARLRHHTATARVATMKVPPISTAGSARLVAGAMSGRGRIANGHTTLRT